MRTLAVAVGGRVDGHAHLYSLCMKAVWTTLGCCAAAAAPTAGAELPLGDVFPDSPFVD